ncbi:MAG: hypothetical protein R3B51_02325 [Thermodesulfobacteriota bacterium]
MPTSVLTLIPAATSCPLSCDTFQRFELVPVIDVHERAFVERPFELFPCLVGAVEYYGGPRGAEPPCELVFEPGRDLGPRPVPVYDFRIPGMEFTLYE